MIPPVYKIKLQVTSYKNCKPLVTSYKAKDQNLPVGPTVEVSGPGDMLTLPPASSVVDEVLALEHLPRPHKHEHLLEVPTQLVVENTHSLVRSSRAGVHLQT